MGGRVVQVRSSSSGHQATGRIVEATSSEGQGVVGGGVLGYDEEAQEAAYAAALDKTGLVLSTQTTGSRSTVYYLPCLETIKREARGGARARARA